MKIKSILPTIFFFGLPTGILLNVLFHLSLKGDKAYLGDDNVSLLLFSVVCLSYIIMYRYHFRKHTYNIPEPSHIVLLILGFSFVVAVCLGLGYFINATFIDPQWADKSLALLQEKWAANNLSKEAIAGQIEWTDTFHNPWKWATVLVIFFSILYSIPGFIIGMLFYLRYTFSKKRTPPTINFQ